MLVLGCTPEVSLGPMTPRACFAADKGKRLIVRLATGELGPMVWGDKREQDGPREEDDDGNDRQDVS